MFLFLDHNWKLYLRFELFFPQSDTPYRRSFTVLDNIVQGRPGRASVTTGKIIIFFYAFYFFFFFI